MIATLSATDGASQNHVAHRHVPLIMNLHVLLQDIDNEHAELKQIALRLELYSRLWGHPQPVDHGIDTRPANCAEIIADFLALLLDLVWKHAQHEETIMKRLFTTREFAGMFKNHVEDHANIAAHLAELADQPFHKAPGRTIEGIRNLVRYWLDDHLNTHDKALTELVELRLDETKASP